MIHAPVPFHASVLVRAAAIVVALGVLSRGPMVLAQSAVSAAAGRTADQASVAGGNELPTEAQGLDPVERTGQSIPMDLQLIDQDGRAVRLGDLFDGRRPVLLVPAYFTCPLACPVMVGKVRDAINGMDRVSGTDFRLVVVSFDPTNTTTQAKGFAEDYLATYRHKDVPGARGGWTFLTGAGAVTKRLMDSIGYPYKYLPEAGQYSHPFMWCVLTPDGTIARYFYGFEFPAQSVKLAMLEAADGKLTPTLGERLLLFCFHYDPSRGAYTLAAMRVMQLCSVAVLGALVTLVGALRVGELRRRRGTARRPAPLGLADPPIASTLESLGLVATNRGGAGSSP
jgi:protein SCO1